MKSLPYRRRTPECRGKDTTGRNDIVFSFVHTCIAAIGIARSYSWESPKPQEFGSACQNWENIDWKVRVEFIALNNLVRPKDHMEVLRPLLPEHYSPLQANGNGIQSVYLTEVPQMFGEVLMGLIGSETTPFMRAADMPDTEREMRQTGDDLDSWQQHIETDTSMRDTEKRRLFEHVAGRGYSKSESRLSSPVAA